MVSLCSQLLLELRGLNAGRFCKPKSELCTHLHPTVVEAVQCAKQLACAADIVAIENDHVDVLNLAEQRICDFVSSYLAQKSQPQSEQLFSESKQFRQPTLYKKQYKCPYGKKRCGNNAIYCRRCNQDYAEFLLKIDEHG
jgi:hypothetical protein